ncbi:MAG: hypothetical protein OM95_11705 [Bdellovibrio sp. ArHS]|uniref:BP74-related protein n=1 Tax=Bdellovibrio sp. ArHS TaxID=1569284 RepID=UPI000583E4D0|nr:hypothetical protein [Bdellovibrio sp. ArHS]KHD87930.1 MAG: hypothetical protein OM95_11705 [Bdellovibrio sp. ArHS]
MDLGIKTSLTLSAWILVFGLSAHASEVVYLPAYCEPERLTVFVTNKSFEPERLWAQTRFEQEIQELHYDVEARSQIKIRGSEFLPTKMAASFKYFSKSLQVTSSCEGSPSIPLTSTVSPLATHYLPANTKSVKMHLLNLFLRSNSVQLKAFNKAGTLVDEKSLLFENYYDTESFKWSFSQPVVRIEIKAAERLHSLLLYDANGTEKSSPSVSLTPVILEPPPQQTYFLVSTKDARADEAFVVGFTDQSQIKTAREQIQNPSLEKILVAGIELGHGGFNRAFYGKDKAPYSWSVNRVDAFADFAHIDCDGSPDLTEERLMSKLNEGGRICFWRYRIVRELTYEEVRSGKLTPAQGRP